MSDEPKMNLASKKNESVDTENNLQNVTDCVEGVVKAVVLSSDDSDKSFDESQGVCDMPFVDSPSSNTVRSDSPECFEFVPKQSHCEEEGSLRDGENCEALVEPATELSYETKLKTVELNKQTANEGAGKRVSAATPAGKKGSLGNSKSKKPDGNSVGDRDIPPKDHSAVIAGGMLLVGVAACTILAFYFNRPKLAAFVGIIAAAAVVYYIYNHEKAKESGPSSSFFVKKQPWGHFLLSAKEPSFG